MRLAVRYITRFLYNGAVWDSHNVLRACPASDDRQRLVEYRVITDPPARVYAYTDYWGTRVDAFGVRVPHPRLEVIAEAIVEMRTATGPDWAAAIATRASDELVTAGAAAEHGSGPTMTALAAPEFVTEHVEFLQPSPHARWAPELRRQAAEWIESAGDDAVAAVAALYRGVGTTLRYAPGATAIGVDVNAVLRKRVGVCQDFAHLLIALCRSVGVPARYVSGYLLADGSDQDPPPQGIVVEVKTHAWVEVALPGTGWLPLDPTNLRPVERYHVKIGHGRDYEDVMPLRGVYHGNAEHQLNVSVRMRELTSAQQ